MKGERARVSTNFHEFRMGNIASKTLYRSSHPIIDAVKLTGKELTRLKKILSISRK